MPKVSRFSASIASRIQAFVSTEETRYYLNGFALQPHPVQGAYIVATDGPRMGIFHDPNAVCAEACVVRLDKSFLAKCKASHKSRCPMRVYLNHDSATAYLAAAREDGPEPMPADLADLPGCEGVSLKVLIDGTFPDWSRVCPPAPQASDVLRPAAYNSKYLAGFGSISSVKGAPIVVYARDAAAPAWVFVSGCPEFIGILMPARGDHSCTLPAWLFQQPKTGALEQCT